MKKLITFLLVTVFICSMTITAFSDAATYDMNPAGYYVYVLTPDGGLNMRHGPGTEYGKAMSGTIPDYTKLYIEYTSGNWGYTNYNGNYGWVALKQTTTNPPSSAGKTPQKSSAGYYVYVATPDGGLNLRKGPGTSYALVIGKRIPDATPLYIEEISDNWGYTNYNGYYGWVALKQTSKTPPVIKETAPEPPAVPEPPVVPEPVEDEEDYAEPSKKGEKLTETASDTNNNATAEVNADTNSDVQKESSLKSDSSSRQIIIIAAILLLVCAVTLICIMLVNKKHR